MYQVIYQEDNKLELLLSGHLDENEFRQVVHQLESLCTMYTNIHVLFDTKGLEKYDFKIILDEFDFYKKYKHHLHRVAVVSDQKFVNFILEVLNKFSETEIKQFEESEIEEARKWIFPSRLP
jgi:hypothetical protein